MYWPAALPPSTWLPLALAGVILLVVGLIAGLAVAGIAAYSAHAVVRPRRDWRPANWHEPSMPVEAIRFANPLGYTLAGWFLAPAPGRPVVIICHGFGTNRREGADLLPWLREGGYGALLFDFQGHGESEGTYTTAGLREVDDLLAAVRYLQDRLGEQVPVVVVGFSMGAAVAILAAARCPAIQAVVADSPYATLQRAVARSFRYFFRLPPRVFTRPTIWFAERFAGGRIGSVAPLAAVGAIAPRPLLIVHGAEDAIIDPEDSLLLHAAAGEPKTLWRVDGCGHVQVRSRYPDEYARRLRACLDAALQTAVERSALRARDEVVMK